MKAKTIIDQRVDMNIAIIDRAWKDETFKKALQSDPKGTLKKEYNIDLPEDFKVKVVDEAANELVLVIPTNHGEEKELSEAELEKVAAAGGGHGCYTYGANTCYPHTGGWNWSCYLNPCGHTKNHDHHGHKLC
ncbi:MAG: NHLP leader peptide family RiPP precursor [Melioribacteraceae bacterium]